MRGAAVARPAEAVRAERADLGEGQERVLQEDPAGVDPPADRLGLLGVAGDHAGGEPERGVVGEADRFLGVGIGHHRDARAERLVLHDQHVVGDAGQHRRAHVEPAADILDLAAGEDRRALGHGIVEVPLRRSPPAGRK